MKLFPTDMDPDGEASRITRTGLFFSLVFVGGFLIWAALAPISGAIPVEGMLSYEDKWRYVDIKDGRKITDIRVKTGDAVHPGDVIGHFLTSESQKPLKGAGPSEPQPLLSPIEGRVIRINPDAIGRPLRAQDLVIEVEYAQPIPIASLRIAPGQIALVRVGQEMEVLLVGAQLRKMPHLKGTLESISPNLVADPERPVGAHFFSAVAKIDQSNLKLPEDVTIRAGMPLQILLHTRSRTFLDMVLKPIADSMSEGLRRD